MTAGTIFLMWIGEQIDEYGIGNGISLLIMAGILARMPAGAAASCWPNSTPKLTPETGKYGIITIVLLAGLFVAVVVGVIAITESQRRIPTQSAKHVRGRRVFGGTRQYLPLKVNQAGVMPIIFASSLLMFPYFILNSLKQATRPTPRSWRIATTWTRQVGARLVLPGGGRRVPEAGYVYTLFYIVLIYFFCYFWTAITFNPKDMAENLKDYGSFIPGYRPGRRTADYLEKVMLRITYVGAAFLSLVAVIPSLVPNAPERRLHDRVVPRRDRPADRHQRLPRPGPEDRQPPDHAELQRPGEQALTSPGAGAPTAMPCRERAPCRDQAEEPPRDRPDARGGPGRRQGARPGPPDGRARGRRTAEMDEAVAAIFREHDAIPLFRGYPNSTKGKPPFPAVICASVNEQVVHGIPNRRPLQGGRRRLDRHRLQAQRLVRRRRRDPGHRRGPARDPASSST